MSDKRPAYRQILMVVLALIVLTAVEFAIAIRLEAAAVFLFIIALVKAGLIVQYFMHINRLWRAEEH